MYTFPLSVLLSKSWRLYRTSPLWHFNTSTAKLHTYSEELSRHLLATPSLESGYGAKVKPLPRFGLDASTAVRIDVHRNNTQQGVEGEGERERAVGRRKKRERERERERERGRERGGEGGEK